MSQQTTYTVTKVGISNVIIEIAYHIPLQDNTQFLIISDDDEKVKKSILVKFPVNEKMET